MFLDLMRRVGGGVNCAQQRVESKWRTRCNDENWLGKDEAFPDDP